MVALAGIVFGAIEGPGRGWVDPVTLTAFGIGVAGLVAWVAWGFVADEPLLDPRLFREPRLLTGVFSITLQFFVFFGYVFVIVQYLQLVLDYSPLRAGLALVPMAMVLGGLSRRVPHLMTKVSRRPLAIAGLLLMALGTGVLTRLGPDSSYWVVLAGIVPIGAGMALATRPRPPTSSPLFPSTSRVSPPPSTTPLARSGEPSGSRCSGACSTSGTGPGWRPGAGRCCRLRRRAGAGVAGCCAAAWRRAWVTRGRDWPTRRGKPSSGVRPTRSTWPPPVVLGSAAPRIADPGRSQPEPAAADQDELVPPVDAFPGDARALHPAPAREPPSPDRVLHSRGPPARGRVVGESLRLLLLARALGAHDVVSARQRAGEVRRLEGMVHIDVESQLNAAVTDMAWLAVPMDYWYAVLHYVVTPTALALALLSAALQIIPGAATRS